MEFHVATICQTVSLALLWLYFMKLFDLLSAQAPRKGKIMIFHVQFSGLDFGKSRISLVNRSKELAEGRKRIHCTGQKLKRYKILTKY